MRLGENCHLHLRSPDFTNMMNECPLEHHAGYPWLKEESVGNFPLRHLQLSFRGKRVLNRLLVLLPSHLKSQSTSHLSPFPSALLFSICDALKLDPADNSARQDDPSVLPSVLSKLRDWRLLDPDHRSSLAGVHKLALDLAEITDQTCVQTSSDLSLTPYPRLRMKWVGADSPSESHGRESSPSSTPLLPLSSLPGVLDSAQERAYALTDLNERRSDAEYGSCRARRLGTPDSEDASAVVSPRRHSASGFRSGCSACRHPRLSGPASTPLSPYTTSVLFSDVNRLDTDIINPFVPPPNHPKPSAKHGSTKKIKREKHKSLRSLSRGAHVDENELYLTKPTGIQQGIGISFPRQCTHSPRISNALLSREPYSPVAASVQRHLEPSRLSNQARQGDKHTFSHRLASVDLRLSTANHASPSDLHLRAPTRAQSFSYAPVNAHGVGSVGARVPKLSSNAGESRSRKRLPFWSQTHRTATTTSPVKPTGSLSPLAVNLKACLANPHPHSFGARSRPSSTSMPRHSSSDMRYPDRRSAFSQTHKHASSVGALPLSPRKRLV